MRTRVLDSWAILAWMGEREPGGDAVEELQGPAEQGEIRLLMSAINVGEVYYFLRKHHSENLAESWRASCLTMPVTIDVPTFDDIWHAATLKSRFPTAYADAFAAALAIKNSCPLVTEMRISKGWMNCNSIG